MYAREECVYYDGWDLTDERWQMKLKYAFPAMSTRFWTFFDEATRSFLRTEKRSNSVRKQFQKTVSENSFKKNFRKKGTFSKISSNLHFYLLSFDKFESVCEL